MAFLFHASFAVDFTGGRWDCVMSVCCVVFVHYRAMFHSTEAPNLNVTVSFSSIL